MPIICLLDNCLTCSFTGIEKQYFKKLEQVETCDTSRSIWDSITETHKHEVKFSFSMDASIAN